MIKLSFYGVRGSTPCASISTNVYGGHTSCVTLECDGKLFIFDAGSGIYDLSLYAQKHYPNDSYLFFTHVHLDHIMGLPFYLPIWKKEHNLHIYAGSLAPYGGIELFLKRTFQEPLFPVPFDKFTGNISCIDFLPGNTIEFGEVKIRTHRLNHPNGAIGYRIEYKGISVCHITDHEHTPGQIDTDLVNFIKETDYFIYDATYDDNIFDKFKGWGHSTWQECLRIAEAANVRNPIIFHHDPFNNDNDMMSIETAAQAINPACIVAKQGMSLML